MIYIIKEICDNNVTFFEVNFDTNKSIQECVRIGGDDVWWGGDQLLPNDILEPCINNGKHIIHFEMSYYLSSKEEMLLYNVK